MSIAARILRFGYWVVWLFTHRWQFNVAKQRRGLEIVMGPMPRPGNTKYLKENIGDIPGEWIIPDGASENKVLYYLHGGAYAIGSINTHRRLVANLAHACRIKAFVIEYSLAPEFVFPAALDQAVTVYRKLLAKGFQPQNIVIAGDSSGGGLAVVTMLKLRDLGLPLPGLAVLLAPWTDLEGLGKSNSSANQHNPINNTMLVYFGKLYAGDHDIRDPLVSPIYADLHGLPPLYIQVSTTELIYDDTVRLAEKARQGNVDVTVDAWEGMEHIWQMFDLFVPESRDAIKKIGKFVRERMKVSPELVRESKDTV